VIEKFVKHCKCFGGCIVNKWCPSPRS